MSVVPDVKTFYTPKTGVVLVCTESFGAQLKCHGLKGFPTLNLLKKIHEEEVGKLSFYPIYYNQEKLKNAKKL